jgi:hypothetical protein
MLNTNVSRSVGFEQGKRMLVFKFMAGGNLWDALQQRDDRGDCPYAFNNKYALLQTFISPSGNRLYSTSQCRAHGQMGSAFRLIESQAKHHNVAFTVRRPHFAPAPSVTSKKTCLCDALATLSAGGSTSHMTWHAGWLYCMPTRSSTWT